MHRFVTEKIAGAGAMIALSSEESEHAARVLRLKPGETVQLLDGEGLYLAELEEVSPQAVRAKVLEKCPSPEAPARAVLWQGLPKADKLELIAQKATELGVWELWPVDMTRCVAKADQPQRAEKKRERLSRIALEAAKQSGRAHVPEVRAVMSFGQALERMAKENFDLVLVAWEEEHALPLSLAVKEFAGVKGMPERVLIVIGPEGGITPEEKEQLSAAGALSVTLGKRILRTETAGLCALAVLWGAMGEM